MLRKGKGPIFKTNNQDCKLVAKTVKMDDKNSEDLASRKANDSLTKLARRTKSVNKKLAIKNHNLQLHKRDVQSNNVKIKENDMKVMNALTVMGLNVEWPIEDNQISELSNEVPKEFEQNRDLLNPEDEQSKEQLEALVYGFQQLLTTIMISNPRMREKIEKAAQKISIFKNNPMFLKIDKDRLVRKKRENRNNQNELNGLDNTKSKEKNDKKPKLSAAELFAKYINTMIREYLGDDQEDKLEKYKCLPEHIEDLEPLANELVEEGYGSIVETEIRINRKNNRQAFILMSNDRETNVKDGIVHLPVARRYAFEGDLVRAFILNPNIDFSRKKRKTSSNIKEENNSFSIDEDELFEEIELNSSPESEINDNLDVSMSTVSEKENCPKAFVIKIVRQTELREIVGAINFTNPTLINSDFYFKLRPHDEKMPMVFIPKVLCMEEVNAIGKDDICGMLYVARILEFDINGHCMGELVQPVGKVGNLQAEIKTILLHNGLKDLKPYEQKYQEMFEGPIQPQSAEELRYREDLRKKCVFTIDPLTAKDLDDAVSVEKLNKDEYEIGVHISDVSYYLQENSELDDIVKHRATSVYLVNEVIHMLPTSLCFKCSLLPGEDKFAFSVFWKWHTEREELSPPRFTRSIINSCSQFAYEHAQKIIDNPAEELDSNDIPDVFNEWTPNDIKWRILLLHQIAQKLKAKRYENGALSINNPKLRFTLDPKTGEPLAFAIEGRQEANFMIEEFMLLANQSAAKFIHDYFPEKSILRNHSPPLAKSLKALKKRLNNVGLEFDISSSKSIYESMQRLSRESSDPKAVEACLSTLLTKPMARAKYFCSEGITSDAEFRHYALSIPIYTHFTSPIRRYPDIMVHRLMAAALNYCPPSQRTAEELHRLVKICNDQKLNAKNAGDESIELFFKRYLKAKQSITLKAVVTEICKTMVNVVIIETGQSISILYGMQKWSVYTKDVPNSILLSDKNSVMEPMQLQLFSTIKINLIMKNEKICGFFARNVKDSNLSNGKDTLKGDETLENGDMDSVLVSQDDNTPSTSSKSRKRRKSHKTNDNKKQDYLAFYAVKN